MLIVVYCLMSWFPRSEGSLIADVNAVLDQLVGPYLGFFRRFIPPFGGIDFSPVIAILALTAIERLLIGILL